MNINKPATTPINDVTRAEPVTTPATPTAPARQSTRSAPAREDRVQISDAARALLAREIPPGTPPGVPTDASSASSVSSGPSSVGNTAQTDAQTDATTLDDTLSDERMQEIQQRLHDGTYLTSETAEHVARAMLRRGDL